MRTKNRAGKMSRPSAPELAIYNGLRARFLRLRIIHDDRALLDGREIDIHIPARRLAIEIHGPIHWLPLFGEQKLKQMRSRDRFKAAALRKLGYRLRVFKIRRNEWSPTAIRRILAAATALIEDTPSSRAAPSARRARGGAGPRPSRHFR